MSDNPQDPKKPSPEAIAAADVISHANKNKMVFALSQDAGDALEKAGYEGTTGPLMYALQQATGSAGPKKAPALAFTQDPTPSDNYLGLYKSKRRLIPDDVLKQVRIADFLIAAILRARGSMMSLFGHLRQDRFDIGVEVIIKPDFLKILTPEQYEKVVARMKRFEQLLLNCGHTEGVEHQDRITLADFMGVQCQNGLTFGRFGTEIIYDRGDGMLGADGNYPFFRFRPIDVSTIVKAVRKGESVGNTLRLTAVQALETLTGEKFPIDPKLLEEDRYAWLQVIDGIPRQAFTHDEMLVFDLFPSTDIEHNGYPVSPIDTVISSVTTHISIGTYEKLYFQNGRASKGMLVIQSDEVDQATLDNMKLQFNASINSVSNSFRTPIFGIGKEDKVDWLSMVGEGARDSDFSFMSDQVSRNIMAAFSISPDELPSFGHLSKGTNSQTLSECIHPDTEILTPNGSFRISKLLGDNDSAFTMVWNGLNWVEAKVFKTGEKQVKETILDSKLSIKTSPDHYFQILGQSGEPEWKPQSELKIGDYVLTNKRIVEGIGEIPQYKGKSITLDMMEVLGWLTGDGTIVAPRLRAGAQLHLFYHSKKERDIWTNHEKTLKDFGLNVTKKEIFLTDEDREEIVERYGFKSVSESRIKNIVYDTEFTNWLFSIGFNSSADGKNIPEFMYTLPKEYRQAFLRGLYSADGGINTKTCGHVILTISNDSLRSQVRNLLSTLGIRTNRSEGTTKEIFVGSDRKTIPGKNKLYVKDKRAFFEQIGFLQDHKQPKIEWLEGSDPESIPLSTQEKYVNMLIKSALPRAYKKDLYAFVSGDSKKKISVPRLCNLLEKANLEVPSWLENYHFSKVEELIDHGYKTQMSDLTVFDDSHAFVANGIVVHNSNNEFKLTAARDTGLRPLILKFQTFFNQRLMPIIDPLLSKICEIKFSGIDAQSKEQESARLQQNMAINMNYDDVMHESDKDKIGKAFGGEFPLNERIQLVLDKYMDVGAIKAEFFNSPSAIIDPLLKYKRDPFFVQYIQLLSQVNPAAVKALFAPKPYALEFLKMNVQDILEE